MGGRSVALASWGPARVIHKWRPVGVVLEGWKAGGHRVGSSRVKADFISNHIHLAIYIFLKNQTFVSLPTEQKESSSP